MYEPISFFHRCPIWSRNFSVIVFLYIQDFFNYEKKSWVLSSLGSYLRGFTSNVLPFIWEKFIFSLTKGFFSTVSSFYLFFRSFCFIKSLHLSPIWGQSDPIGPIFWPLGPTRPDFIQILGPNWVQPEKTSRVWLHYASIYWSQPISRLFHRACASASTVLRKKAHAHQSIHGKSSICFQSHRRDFWNWVWLHGMRLANLLLLSCSFCFKLKFKSVMF